MHQSEKINDTIHTMFVVIDEYNINLDRLISCFTCNQFTNWIQKLTFKQIFYLQSPNYVSGYAIMLPYPNSFI